MSAHPMDEIPVRNLRFDVMDLGDDELVWSRSCPEFAMFINALGVHVPYFERFLIAVMRAHRDEIEDQELRGEIQAIIGQEAHHAFNFSKLNQRLAQKYPGIGKLDAGAKTHFERLLKYKSKKFQIGHTAGYETFTFLAGAIILDRYEELMADAHPDLRALWVWHQVEEVEHGAVAFDFYKVFYGDDEWYRRYMVLHAFLHIAKETGLAFREIVKGEQLGWRGKLKAWRYFCSFAWDLFYASLPVYRRSYHPRHHPICNENQNPVAVAWRQYHAAGKNTVSLKNEDMANLMTGQSL